MRVLGIDPGTQHTGWGIVDEISNRLNFEGMGVITTSSRITLSKKLKSIHDGLVEVVIRFSPDVIVVEDTFLSKNIQIAFKLGQARGVALLIGELYALQVAEYTPTQIKLAVTGYGAAHKTQIQMMVTHLLKLGSPPESDHAADALAAAICHHHSAKMIARRLGAEVQKT
ncbi:MAG: crossover junction endodeoxyribonuclease RuvC [Nitrospirae bacterium]|nr:crossover junction endodeoxyribonuclease RuvC [Nitrospirota bacterium]MBI3593581.1 crossover junction endodeoxyribonuclease RuvC [Nitrospirota bacterium]